MQTIYFNGKISLDESDLSRMNYLVEDLTDHTQKSITDILDTIYNSKDTVKKLIRVSGRIYNSNHIFNGFESLHISKDKYNTYSYHVGNFPLENQLFEIVGQCCELVLEDYTDSTSDSEVQVHVS